MLHAMYRCGDLPAGIAVLGVTLAMCIVCMCLVISRMGIIPVFISAAGITIMVTSVLGTGTSVVGMVTSVVGTGTSVVAVANG